MLACTRVPGEGPQPEELIRRANAGISVAASQVAVQRLQSCGRIRPASDQALCKAAKKRRPERWSGATRDWQLKEEVWLNPERSQPEALKQAA